MIGMEHLMAARAANPALGDELKRAVAKAGRLLRHSRLRKLPPGNADGGLTTDEESHLARTQNRDSRPSTHRQAGHRTAAEGTVSLDVVPDGEALRLPKSTTTPRLPSSSRAARR